MLALRGRSQKSKAVKFPPFRKEREMVGQAGSKLNSRFTGYTFQTRVGIRDIQKKLEAAEILKIFYF
jgi:hypothetical protein